LEQAVVSGEGPAIMPEFLSDEIKVIRDEETRNPISFIWRDKEYWIKEIIAFWPDFSYSEVAEKTQKLLSGLNRRGGGLRNIS
jgi:hypothetical protein